MRKPLLAFLLGLSALVVVIVAGALSGPGVVPVMLAYFFGCGFLIARKSPRPLPKEWPSLLALTAPLLILSAAAMAGGPPRAGAAAMLGALVGWEIATAGIYFGSRRATPVLNRKAVLMVTGLPALAFCGAAFAAYQAGHLRKPPVIDGLQCASGWTEEGRGGLIQRCTLASDALFRGIAVPAGSEVITFPSGDLRLRLGRETAIANALLPRGANVGVKPDGQLDHVFLPRDMEIQGLLCRGSGDSWMTDFHPNGKLAHAWLARDQVVQGVPCSHASFWRELNRSSARADLYLWPDGSLRYCRAAQAATVQGVAFREGDPVRLDERGMPAPVSGISKKE